LEGSVKRQLDDGVKKVNGAVLNPTTRRGVGGARKYLVMSGNLLLLGKGNAGSDGGLKRKAGGALKPSRGPKGN